MPKKRANSRTASSSSGSSASASSTSANRPPNNAGGASDDNHNLPLPGNFIGGMQLTPAMVREFMEASKKAGIDHNGGIVNQRGNSRHVTGDLNKLVAMANASSNTAAATAAAASNAGGGNATNSNNGQSSKLNNSNSATASNRGKVTGVKIVRQTVPFVGPPPPPGHASSNNSSSSGSQKPVAMGVSATFSKADGSTATVDLDAAAIASMMSQANSNNPEAFNAGLKQILAAASSAAAAQQSGSSSSSQQTSSSSNEKQSLEANFNAISVLNPSCSVGTRNAVLADKISMSYGGVGEDGSGKTSGSNKTSSKKKSSSSSNSSSSAQQHQQSTAQIQSLFSSLFNMAQQMDSSSSSTTASSQESIQNDFASFRKAAFVAGVNVAIQQEVEREAQHEMEKMNQQLKKLTQQQQQQQQQQNSAKLKQQKQQSKSKKREGANSATTANTAKSNVFSMIFGGGGGPKAATATSSSSATNKNGSTSNSSVVPIIPPPPGGFPQDSLVAQAASALSDYSNTDDDDEHLNLAVSLGSRLLKSVNMSLDTEDDARRAYDRVTSCLSAEERNIVDSFATNFAVSDDVGGMGEGFGCLPEELLNVMSKSMASVMNLDNSDVMERFAREMDRVKRGNGGTSAASSSQDRPTFEHLPDDNDKKKQQQQHKREEEEKAAAAAAKAAAEEEERKAKEQAEEEERKRELKASKRRDKKARQKERLKREAEQKAAAAAIKKRERTITSWRSRVIAACASGDARKMEMLIGESPYRNYTFTPVVSNEDDDASNDNDNEPKNQEEYLLRQLNWFLPNCLQKYQTKGSASFDALPFEFNVARELLAKYILSTSFDVFREPVPSYSRTSIHSAAFANDVDFIKWVLHNSKESDRDFLESPCTDAGWTPLHYATAGGAKSALELLMSEKCNVKARSNPSLTSFRTFTPYQSSNGITARELAVVLQAGAVDDDLTSKAAILDEIVDKRIANVSSSDKTSYMRILKAIEERLKEVEKNGYWPLPDDEEQIALVFEETPSESASSAAPTKKSKKKKKKKAKEANSTPAPVAASLEPEVKSKSSTGDDLSDPVAVALLGMGFSEEQIKAAAKAFGGYVAADDMVMWILSGGDTSAIDQSDANSQQNSQARSRDSSVSITSSTKSATPKPKTLTRAQKKAEDAARKRQEDIANAQKAAAKREEQRRLRREWNEREQARQQEEKNAKLAKALEKQRQAEMEKMVAEMPRGPAGPGIPMSINIGGGGGGKGGPPMTIVAGGKKSSKKSNMGIPQAPTVKAPKILARPSDASKGSAGNQPLFTKPAPSKSSSRGASKPSNPSTHQPTMILKKGAKSQSMASKGISASAPEFRPPGMSDGSTSSAGSAGKQKPPVQKNVAKKSAAPPGFHPAVPGKATSQPGGATPYEEPNHMGMIRATAREFVPSFAPSPVSEDNVVPSMSAQSSSKQPPAPQLSSLSNENPSTAPAAASASSLIEPMSSLLSNVSSSPTPPTTLSQPLGVDPTVSAASSITGLSGTLSEEKPSTSSRVGSIMTFESNTATSGGGLQGSSILESISYGVAPADQGNSGLGSIWGGGASNTNQSDTLGGLGGFDFSSFMQDGALAGQNDTGDTTKGNTSLGGNALGNNTWGSNIGGDSIW